MRPLCDTRGSNLHIDSDSLNKGRSGFSSHNVAHCSLIAGKRKFHVRNIENDFYDHPKIYLANLTASGAISLIRSSAVSAAESEYFFRNDAIIFSCSGYGIVFFLNTFSHVGES